MSGKFLKKKKNWFARHKIFTTICVTVLMLILAVVLTVVGYAWSKLNLIQYDDGKSNAVGSVETQPQSTAPSGEDPTEATEEPGYVVDISGLEISETEPPIPEMEVVKEDDIVNILLIGTDERTTKFNVNARSDSMIVVSINKDKKTVKLVSLERGMGVPILDGQYEGEWDILTHIFRYGGADLLTRTVEHCFKIEIDHYVRLNFHSVEACVDAIGGIEVELTGEEAWALNKYNWLSMREGTNHLDGRMALGYARLRSIDSDWQRVQRQRKVILAVVNKLKGSSFSELDKLLNEVLPLIQTNMTKLDIAELMLYAPNFLNSTFDQMTIPKQGTYGGMTGLNGAGLFAVDFEVNNKILHDFLYGEEPVGTVPTE